MLFKEKFQVKPFLKWVGGKRQLVSQLLPFVPNQFDTYHEHFVGGGALFFELKPKKAILCDKNYHLIRTYTVVRDHVEDLIKSLKELKLQHNKKNYLELRKKELRTLSDIEAAAIFIYINKTGYNGLWRVNKKDICNVPFGTFKNPNICDEENLRACSIVLQNTKIVCEDFRISQLNVHGNDFVYYDPPYIPLNATSNFTSYTSDGFYFEDQKDLEKLAQNLKNSGVNILLSNSSSQLTYDLYKNWHIKEVLATRNVNCKSDKRGTIKELIIS